MRQHFSAIYEKEMNGFVVVPDTGHADLITDGQVVWVFSENNEITRGCINRIVDNLNKLAEHAARNSE